MTQTVFALGLGSYDSSAAIRTLPAQLELLRTFCDLARPDAALIYRLNTVREPEGDLGAFFKLICAGRTPDALESAESEALLDQASVTFGSAWQLTIRSDEPALPRAKHRSRLQPVGGPGLRLPIKPDWAPLVDLLRRRDGPMTVDLTCTLADSHRAGAETVLTGAALNSHRCVPSGDEQKAAEFFLAVGATPSDRSGLLALHLTVHSESAVNAVFARSVGRLALGLPVTPVPVRNESISFPRNQAVSSVQGTPEEAIRAFHPPYGLIQGRGLAGTRAIDIPIRFRVPRIDGPSIGNALRQGARHDARVPVQMDPKDRLKHLYILGKTGAGKTTVLKNLVRQDIVAGRGVAVIDPHGGLVDYALRHVGDRVEEVVLLDFSDADNVPVFNPLLADVGSKHDQDMAVEELLEVIVRRTFNQFTGPIFDDTVRMMLASATSEPLTQLIHPTVAAAVELFRNDDARAWLARTLKPTEPILAQEWATFNSMLGHNRAEHMRWVLAKFADFAPGSVLYAVTGGPQTDLSLNEVFSERRILLVKIPESVIGSRAAGIIGSLIFARLHRAALGQLPNTTDPFQLYVDEFQKFVSADIEGLVAEARKFNLALTLAHQNLRQLDAFSRFEGTASGRLREALFSNVGTIMCMRLSGADVQPLSQEFGLDEREMRRIAQYDGLVRAVVGGVEREPFSVEIPHADKEAPGHEALPRRVRRLMREHGYWRPRAELSLSVDQSIEALRKAWSPRTQPGVTPGRGHLPDLDEIEELMKDEPEVGRPREEWGPGRRRGPSDHARQRSSKADPDVSVPTKEDLNGST